MADNIAVTAGSGTTVATDDVGGVHTQRVKVQWGPDGTVNDADVASGKPIPVQLRGSDGTDRSNALPVTASIAAAQTLATVTTVGTVSSVTAIAGALPAGNNNIGDVDIASIAAGNNNIGDVDVASIAAGDNNIGNVDVLTVITGTGATNLGKAEDAAHTTGDTGVMALAVRSDAGTVTAADGDYVPLLVNSSGALYVTGGGGGTQYVEDIAAANDPTGTVIIGVRRDTLVTNEVTAENDNIAIKATNKGQLHVFAETGTLTVASHAVTVASGGVASGAIASGAVASGAFASGALASGSVASGAIAAGAIAAGATSIADNEDVASADGDRGVKILFKRLDSPANSSGTSGDYEQPQMAAGRIWVSATIDAALPAGTAAIGKLSANSGVDIGDVDVTTVGTITPGTAATNLGKAEDAAHSSGDVGVMALAVRQDSETALAGTSGDYIPLSVDSNGYLRVTVDPRQTDGAEYEIVAASATDQAIGAAGATGDYLSHVEVFPGTAGCGVVTIKDNTTVWGTFAGGGTTALPTLVPFTIPVGVNSVSGAWKITTGANVTCVAVGNFT